MPSDAVSLTDDQIVEGIKHYGTITQVADAHGIVRQTLSEHINRSPELAERVRAARPLHAVHHERPAKGREGTTPVDESDFEPKPVDDPDRIKLNQLEAERKVLRKERKDLEKALASQSDFFDKIVEATRVPVDHVEYKTHVPPEEYPVQSVIAPIFDQQFGQFVRPSDTPGGKGGFSVEVFDKRLTRWVDGVTGIIAKRAEGYRIDELLLPLGGDHVEGDEIFPGQPWQLELDPPKQVWELASRMDAALCEVIRFAKEDIGVEHIGLYGITGNHGKVGGKRGGARPSTYNWDWLFLKILFDRLRAQPLDDVVIEPGGSLFFYCAGHEFQAIHGDQIKGWGSLPFYGLTKYDGRSIRLHNRIYRYLLMGHHHQPAQVPNGAGETIISGDWVGATNLSAAMTAASRPQQNVIFVSDKWGVMAAERIYFQEADEAYTPTPIHGRAA